MTAKINNKVKLYKSNDEFIVKNLDIFINVFDIELIHNIFYLFFMSYVIVISKYRIFVYYTFIKLDYIRNKIHTYKILL